MMFSAFQVLVWIIGTATLIAVASWWAHRSYRGFLKKARGPSSHALPVVGQNTPMDDLLAPLQAHNPGKSGLMLLLDNADAFAARALSAAQAGRSLDLMYYIWRTDLAGWLLIDHLVAAADRGVRDNRQGQAQIPIAVEHSRDIRHFWPHQHHIRID